MTIHLVGDFTIREVYLNGEFLSPKRSLKVRNHSPDGFNWGYGGSGPAQLALAICLELFNSSENYQDFKFNIIAALPRRDIDATIEFDEKTFKLIKLVNNE